MKIKKLVIPAVVIIVLSICGGVYLNYYRNDKIQQGVACKSLDKDGKPIDTTNTFSIKDGTVYVAAKSNSIFVKKAKIEWYKDQVADANLAKVDKDVPLSKDGYFNSKLSTSDGLKEGKYRVIIHSGDSINIESIVDFEIK